MRSKLGGVVIKGNETIPQSALLTAPFTQVSLLPTPSERRIVMDFEIIDFHTHPFLTKEQNVCSHIEYCDMSAENTVEVFKKLGISKICGSVIRETAEGESLWEKIKSNNDTALALAEQYQGFYIPGFHIHPDFLEESFGEIERMSQQGVKLIGELVPYFDGWSDYSDPRFSQLLDEAGKRNMIVSFHSMGEDAMDQMVKDHPDVIFVAAHPGEYYEFMRHLERMKYSENYYLDVSGYGIFRYGMLRHAIDAFGAERILFGSDYPTCNPGMYVGGVLLDNLLTDKEKEKIFSLNAKKLLNI